MSINIDEITNKCPHIIDIVPSLDDVTYADNLNGVFKNINDNFIKLANHDFVKGDSGDSVKIIDWKLFNNDGTLNTYGKLLESAILDLLDGEETELTLSNGKTVSVWDKFYEKNENGEYSKIPMVCNVKKDIGDVKPVPVPVSSLYYVFLDGRYNNDSIGLIDQTVYNNINDISCILVYNGTKFEVLSNAFPTIYYENGVGLCWKINGIGSGIPVQGLPGKNGTNATLYIVKSNIEVSDKLGVVSRGVVSHIYESKMGYRPISDYDIELLDKQAALIIQPSSSSNDNLFYFGTLELEEIEYEVTGEDGNYELDEEGNPLIEKKNILCVYCSPDNAINTTINNESVINAMKSINIANSDSLTSLKGLFIPLEDMNDNAQKVHLLTSTSIKNDITGDDEKDLKTDVLFTPIDDINTLNINRDNKLQVDRYLYLKVNKNRNFLFDPDPTDDEEPLYDNHYLDKYNYCIKYKLAEIISNTENLYLSKESIKFGSVYYGSDGNRNRYDLSKDNVIYLSTETTVIRDAKFTDNILESMPKSFIDKLNSAGADEHVHGIYRWEICNEKADYDIDELLNSSYDSYDFDNNFKYVYTTTLTPSSNTEFLWFNGFELVENYTDKKAENTDKFAVYGWNGDINISTFEFMKFVPIYNNDFAVDTDTALNLNYNINITGDEKNPNKSITVHGNVNCDNLSVYRLTATKEIKNISTHDDIYGRRGIYLWENSKSTNEQQSYDFEVKAGGEVVSKSLTTDKVNVKETLSSNNSVSNELETYDFNVKSYNDKDGIIGDGYVSIKTAQDDQYDKINIEANNTQKISITSAKVDIESLSNGLSNAPMVYTDMPMHYNESSGIVISNQESDSDMIYHKNALGEITIKRKDNTSLTSNPGPGVSNSDGCVIDMTSFDSAKNFNMHRLALSGVAGGTSSEVKLETTNGSSKGTSSTADNVYLIRNSDSTVSRCNSFDCGNIDDSYYNAASYIKSNYMLEIDLVRKEQNAKINRSNRIKIKFNNDFFFNVGIETGQSNGLWGQLHSDSFMYFDAYFVHNEKAEKLNLYTGGAKRYFDYATTDTSDDNGFEWVGHSEKGDKSYKGDGGDYKWRYYSMVFKPSTIEINNSGDSYKAMCDEFDKGVSVKLYIVPRFYLKAHSQDYWLYGSDRIAGIRVTTPKPLTSSKYTNNIKTLTDTSKSDNRLSIYKTITNITGCNTVEYYVIQGADSGSNVKSTTICNDGLVITSGNYVFGLGYVNDSINYSINKYSEAITGNNGNPHWKKVENMYETAGIPVLFYHEYNSNYYDKSGNPNKNGVNPNNIGDSQADLLDNKGYALRTNYIPLKDIFEAIKIMKSTSTATYGV